MTKKIVCLLLVCLILVGCGPASSNPVGNTDSSGTNAESHYTENQVQNTTAATDATGNTESTDATVATEGAEDTEETEETEEEETEEITGGVTTPKPNTNIPTVVIPTPTTPSSYWKPICNDYITLFSSTGGSAIGRIPKNATVGLLYWTGNFAKVTYNGQTGYVYAYCLQPADSDYFSNHLSTVTLSTNYSYDQMRTDMKKLQALYPDRITISSIGKSEMGRDIPVMIVGKPVAKYQILVQGAMHGREHFTACLAMAMADCILKLGFLPQDACYHIIPMSNPDGVVISQTGTLAAEQMAVYNQDKKNGYASSDLAKYAQQWKANALGVDINRNFVVGWIPSDERSQPSSEKYRGTEPFSSAEALALCDYTLEHNLDATLSLHAYGNVLYYQYGAKQYINSLTYSLAKAVQSVTGYIPTATDNTTGAGYKDWVMDDLGIPSLTVEIGGQTVPISQQDMYNTFDRCQDMLRIVYEWLTHVKE